MRKALILVAVVACDGPVAPLTDGGVIGDEMVVMPDAPPSIDGMWRDTFHTTAGPQMISGCTTPPTALKVDATSGVVTAYNGICMPDGSFRILAPGNLGTFFLKVGASLYESAKRAGIDLSTNRLGRNDVAAITGVTLDLNLTGAKNWATGDVLMAFGANIGYRQPLTFTSGAPTNGATTIMASAPWSGYKIDSAKSDSLEIVQLGKHTTATSLDYVSLDRTFTVPAFTMVNNTPVPVTGALTQPSTASIALSINTQTFNQFSTIAAPSVTQKTIQGTVFAAVSPEVIESPPLVSFAQTADGFAVMNYGTINYGDPFPGAWQRYVKIQVNYNVPYTYSAASGNRSVSMERMLPKSSVSGQIEAIVGPPTAVKFDGDDALTDMNISPVPVVSWSPPSTGTPTDYEVQVFEVKTTGTSLSFTPLLRLVTKATSLRIPTGYLLGQRQYVFSIKARVRDGIDVHDTPLKFGSSWGSAEFSSAVVTTDS